VEKRKEMKCEETKEKKLFQMVNSSFIQWGKNSRSANRILGRLTGLGFVQGCGLFVVPRRIYGAGKMASEPAKRERLRKSALDGLALLNFDGAAERRLRVCFEEGPLGLQILDVDGVGVLVWEVSGQAAVNSEGRLRMGARVDAVGGESTLGMSMEEVFALVKEKGRPLEIDFSLPMQKAAEKQQQQQQQQQQQHQQQTQVRLEPLKKSVTSRLRKFSVAGSSEVTSPRKDDTVCVVFKKGSLGLQISDVGKRVLVTAFENNPDGSRGQAERSGLVHFGYQVIKVGQMIVEGMSMHQIGMIVQKQKRPVAITFRKLYERRKEGDGPARATKKRVMNGNGISNGDASEDEEDENGFSKQCTCGGDAEITTPTSQDPMYFHFMLLCKSSQIQILLDYEASVRDEEDAKLHPAFEIASLHMPTLYKTMLSENVLFPDWPVWIRNKYLEAYIRQTQETGEAAPSPKHEDLDERENIEKKEENDLNGAMIKEGEAEHDEPAPKTHLCLFCRNKKVLRRKATEMDDEMFIHFSLLFKTVKVQAANSNIDQEGYLEYLSGVDVLDLYSWCQKDGISMHQWFPWIKKQCAISYEEQLYKIALSGDVEIDLRSMIEEYEKV